MFNYSVPADEDKERRLEDALANDLENAFWRTYGLHPYIWNCVFLDEKGKFMPVGLPRLQALRAVHKTG